MPLNTFLRFFAFTALCGALWGTPAHAEKADKDKPMNIEADNMRHDENLKLTKFNGNIVALKGTLIMRASRMEVQEDSQGQQIAKFWAAPKERIFFRQKREGVDEYTEGEGETAIYDKQADQITLVQRAEARILRGSEVANQVSGDKIVFNNTTEVMTVDGQPKGQAAAGRGERVRAVLTPRKEPSAPPATSTPTPTLRSSPTLGESKKP
jgi:lipopolysaccharide export system protein LptA